MANKEKPERLRMIIGDENADKMGNYQMATGGGTPLDKGEKLKNHPEAKRVMQPRDENGQFTYNAANFMTRKYAYHGDGDTIPPYLRGVNLSYFVKKDTEINYNNKIYLAGIKMSAEEMIERLKEYKEGEGFGKKLHEKMKGKPGRRSNITKKKMAEGAKGVLDDAALPLDVSLTSKEMLEKLKQRWKEVHGKKKTKKVVNPKDPEDPKDPKDPKGPKGPKGNNDNDDNDNNNQNNQNKFDSKLAKENPQEFVQQNKEKIVDIQKEFPDLSVTEIVDIIATGEFETIDDIRKVMGE